MKILLTLIACCQLFALITCDVKTWTKNTNYDDPKNWNGGGIACSNDRKVFPKELVASVYVQQNESLQELVLSDNMVLTFGDGVVLTFNTDMLDSVRSETSTPSVTKDVDSVSQQTSPPPATCERNGRVVEFSAKASSWFDPQSWSTQQTAANDSAKFMLDLERIPCREDRVVFPSKNTFLVNIENQNIQAGSMLIHNEEFTSQSTFSNYWAGNVSPYEFVHRSTNTPAISGLPCGDDRTCQCSDRYSEKMKTAVCKYKKCNEELPCQNPLLPKYGQCCQLCGASLQLSVDVTESEIPFTELHNRLIDSLHAWSNVRYTIGPLIKSTMEIILIDGDGDGKTASLAVCSLRELMLTNETSLMLGLSNVTFVRSDGVDNCNKPDPATHSPITAKPPAKWDYIIIGVSLGFAVVCILVVVLGVFLYRRKYASSGKNEMELGRVGSARSSQGFDNPVYDTPLPFEDNFIVSYDASEDQINGFDNALYSADTNSGGEIHTEKKTPLEDPYAPVVKKSKKKAASGGKRQKETQNLGFDNPVYAVGDGHEGTGSMESVPLDEDDMVPEYVQHDGTGFANPIATGLSEEMMAPPLPKKEPLTNVASKGFDNPLYSEDPSAAATAGSELGGVTVQVRPATITKKKKSKNGKTKDHKGKIGNAVSKEQGFGNPMYGLDDDAQNFYQPETLGEEDSRPAPIPDDDEL